jgi:sec-independent protein translocase protein TatC
MASNELSLIDHLRELRRRIFWSVIALLVGTLIAFVFFRQIIELLVLPARDFGASQGLELVYTEVTELLSTSVKVSFMAGFVLSSPVVMYHVIRFVAPGLTRTEQRSLILFLPAVLLAFIVGVAFGYYVLTPPALKFLLTFGNDVATPLIKISNIVNVMVRLLFWMGVSFETPLVLYMLARLGIVNARRLARFRRFWLVIAFLLAAIITPTFDPFNQALVAIPLLVLYEVGIILAKLAQRRRAGN